MTSRNLISHVCETRKFVMAILHGKQGMLCDKTVIKITTIIIIIIVIVVVQLHQMTKWYERCVAVKDDKNAWKGLGGNFTFAVRSSGSCFFFFFVFLGGGGLLVPV